MSITSPYESTVALDRSDAEWRTGAMPKNGSDDSSLDRLGDTPSAATATNRSWKRAHHRRLVIVDLSIIVVVVAVAHTLRPYVFGYDANATPDNWYQALLVPVLLVVAWTVVLELQQSRDVSLVGVGVEEYRRVVSATVWVFGLLAVSTLLFKVEMSRGFLALALPLGMLGLIAGRRRARSRLARERSAGASITRVVVLGKPDAVAMVAECFERSAAAGYRIVGACLPDFDGDIASNLSTPAGEIAIFGDDTAIESALRLTEADALAVAAVEHLGHKKMKTLLWQLEALGTELIVVPGMTDIASPRFLMRPLDDLPLFSIAPARQAGPSAISKRTFDLALGLVGALLALPVIALAAAVIKLEDGGPVFFRQVRVGHRGNPFRIFKLRTMSVNAEALKPAIRTATGQDGVFYKSACDSRITRVGKFLRATSIDELPQLFNVLGGSMSMVGPRPLVPGEGGAVENFLERRGLVKPGITGLWQISGRSDLCETERIRLDYSYVDNWSCVLDLTIVWRTVRAVLKREGAY